MGKSEYNLQNRLEVWRLRDETIRRHLRDDPKTTEENEKKVSTSNERGIFASIKARIKKAFQKDNAG